MSETGAQGALEAGDAMLRELAGSPHVRPADAPRGATMGRLKRISYTHDALIDLIIAQPELNQNELAAHFGYTPGWISNILAADAFQTRLALRRDQIIDPTLKATIEERMRALYIKAMGVLSEKLDKPAVSDTLAIRCAELGAKGLGIGGHGLPPAPDRSEDRLARLAERLIALNPNAALPQPQEKVVYGETLPAEASPAPAG